jgi:hypothetical protein
VRLVEGLWIYPQSELMTFFRSVATDLREDVPIFVIGFTARPAREVIQTASLYRGRLIWFDHHSWPPEDVEALRVAIGATACTSAGLDCRCRVLSVAAAQPLLRQAGGPGPGAFAARLRALGLPVAPRRRVGWRRGERRGDIEALVGRSGWRATRRRCPPPPPPDHVRGGRDSARCTSGYTLVGDVSPELDLHSRRDRARALRRAACSPPPGQRAARARRRGAAQLTWRAWPRTWRKHD